MPARPVRPDSGPPSGNHDRKPASRAWRTPARATAALLACALSTTACASGPVAAHRASPAGVALPQIPAGGRERVPSALFSPVGHGLPRPLVDPASIIPGGPPPDGIPAIDRPRF